MAEPSTVARPYAEAAFKLADAAGALGRWSEMLAALAQVAQDARVRAAVADPTSPMPSRGLFIAILAASERRGGEFRARSGAETIACRWLPEIHGQFGSAQERARGVVEAEVQSAFESHRAQLADLIQRLEKKTGRKVRAQVSVDRELIGGVKVVLGDKVIDGSARAQLARSRPR